MRKFIEKQIEDSIRAKTELLNSPQFIEMVQTVSRLCQTCYERGGKTLFCGNGGSAADAQHLAAEFVSRFYFDRPGLASMALTTDTSVLTAIGNDYGYEKLFARQIEANGRKGDILFAISTSGNSVNVLNGIAAAKRKEITVVGLTGSDACNMDDVCDYCFKVPSSETPRIQESHIMIGHIICAVVENEMFSQSRQ